MGKTLTVDDIFDRFPNKYEAIVVIAREARRLNELGRMDAPEQREKAPRVALERVLRGEVDFTYRKKVRPRPWPDMAGPEVLETREEPVTPTPTGLWKEEEEEEQEEQKEEPKETEETEEQVPQKEEASEPSAEESSAADPPEHGADAPETSEEKESLD